VKPATDPQPVPSQVVKTTTTRIVAVPDNSERSTPDLWEYLESLNTKDSTEWDRHLIYIYRVEPAPSVPVEKCVRHISMPDGTQIPLSDQEAVEFALMQKYGGKVFRLIVKRGAERITQGRVYIDAPARPITVQPDMGGGGTTGTVVIGMSDSAQIAGKAIDTIAGQEHQAVNLGLSMMSTAANVVKNFSTGGGGGDELTRQFMAVMMQRMLTPPPDPIELLTKLLTLQQAMAPQRAGQPDEMTAQVLKVALERMLNPTPAGAPISASAELVRQFPQIGSTVVEGLREFRLAREAEASMVAMQRGSAPPLVAQNPQLLSAVPGGTSTTSPQNGAPSMEFVEQRLVEILRQPVSAAQAADDAMAFLDGLDPNAIKELAKLGETGLLGLFQKRPVLKQATNNMPRLVEFIRAFLKLHAEDEAAAAADAAQPKPAPPLPN
jgi:hypothetical protein